MTSGRAGRAALRHADSHAIYRTHVAYVKKDWLNASLKESMVGRQGFEPWTLGLRVPCSAS